MNCREWQVWAGNAARAMQERHELAEPASNYFQIRWLLELHRRVVLASCVSLSPPQAAGLVHSAARPLPTRLASLGSCGGPILSPKGGTRGKRARLALTGPFRPSSPQAPYRSLPRRAGKLIHSAAAPLPTEPASLGFGGAPFFPAAFGYFSPVKSTSPKGSPLIGAD